METYNKLSASDKIEFMHLIGLNKTYTWAYLIIIGILLMIFGIVSDDIRLVGKMLVFAVLCFGMGFVVLIMEHIKRQQIEKHFKGKIII